jgi:hypothetical protein
MVSIGLVISILLFIVVLPIVVFLGGVLKAYILASWTLTYRYLIGDENLEPLVLNSEEKDQETDEAQEG